MSIWKPSLHGRRAIRLLLLQPAPDVSSQLVGDFAILNLDEDSLDENAHYEALSYCWGNCPKTTTILISGQQHGITLNLSDALRKLRLHDEQRTLWADALCISQFNNEEKAEQVQMMDAVYNKAATVHVWLEDRRPNGNIARGADWAMIGEVGKDPEKHFDTYPALCMHFGIDWWNRMWTVQEALLASTLR